MKLLIVVVVGVCFVGTLAAQERRERRWTAPLSEASRENPVANRPDAVAGGKKLFQQRCSVCHADDGTGTNRGPNLTTSRVQRQSDGELFWQISSGNTRSGMPGFSFLPELQRWQLVLYLREQ
jgi:mono/diheme cytochrome c family protein